MDFVSSLLLTCYQVNIFSLFTLTTKLTSRSTEFKVKTGDIYQPMAWSPKLQIFFCYEFCRQGNKLRKHRGFPEPKARAYRHPIYTTLPLIKGQLLITEHSCEMTCSPLGTETSQTGKCDFPGNAIAVQPRCFLLISTLCEHCLVIVFRAANNRFANTFQRTS